MQVEPVALRIITISFCLRSEPIFPAKDSVVQVLKIEI